MTTPTVDSTNHNVDDLDNPKHNPSAPYNQIGNLTKLNETNEELRDSRNYNLNQLSSSKDGGFNISDEVIFYSMIDKQYIYGTILDKKKDKISRDYIYKISKSSYKADPDIVFELSKRKNSSKKDEREELIKLRKMRSKKTATINWKPNHKFNDKSYYKLMEINNFKIELQYALLKIFQNKLINVIKKNQKQKKLNKKTKKLNKNLNKEKNKKHRMIQSMSVITDIQSKSIQKKRSKIKNTSNSINNKNNKNNKVNKPIADPLKWTSKEVATWFMWMSQNECEYETDPKLSEFEKSNYRKARKGLFNNYALKFVENEINGIKLNEMDNVTLNNKLFVNDKAARKIIISSVDKLFNRQKKVIRASQYDGTIYDFDKDKKGFLDANKLMYKSSSNANFDKRKEKLGKTKHKRESIGINRDYVIPDYADKAIADAQIGSATDERSRFGGNSAKLDEEFKKLMIEAKQLNITLPSDLLTNKLGFHTKQKQNADIQQYLMREKRLIMSSDINHDNHELQRFTALANARKQFNIRDKIEKKNIIRNNDIQQIKKIYGNKHQIFQKAKLKIKENEQKDKKKKSKQKLQKSKINLLNKNQYSHSLALHNIDNKYKYNKYNKINKKKHKTNKSISTRVHVVDKPKNNKKKRKKKVSFHNNDNDNDTDSDNDNAGDNGKSLHNESKSMILHNFADWKDDDNDKLSSSSASSSSSSSSSSSFSSSSLSDDEDIEDDVVDDDDNSNGISVPLTILRLREQQQQNDVGDD